MRKRTSRLLAASAAVLSVLAVAACGSTAGAGSAANYPGNDPIEMVVQVSPGGGWDTVSRALAQDLPKYLKGAKVEVLNRTGGSGLEQFGYVAQDADGHRLGPLPLPGIVSASISNPDIVDMSKVTTLGSVGEDPYVVVASKKSGITSLHDLATRQKVTVGSSAGVAGGDYFLNVLMQSAFDGDWEYVNHEGSTEAALSAVRGDVDIITQPLSSILPQLDDPNLVPLVMFSDKAEKGAEDVPLAKDQPETKDFADLGRIYRVFFVSKNTPEAIVTKLRSAVKSVTEDQSYIDSMAKAGSPAKYLSPEQTNKVINDLEEVANQHKAAFQ